MLPYAVPERLQVPLREAAFAEDIEALTGQWDGNRIFDAVRQSDPSDAVLSEQEQPTAAYQPLF